MARGQKHSGRALFPFGPSTTPDDSHAIVFSLLKAAPFVLRGPEGAQVLTWTEPGLAAAMLDHSIENLPRSHSLFMESLPPSVQAQRRNAMYSLSFDGARYLVNYQLTRSDQETCWIEESGERIKGDGDMPTHIVCVLRDVTAARERRDQIEHDLNTDALTGFMTETNFLDILRHGQILGQSPQIIRIRLKDASALKIVYGPLISDYVFKAVSKRVSGELAPTDYAAFDGDQHFQIYYPSLDADQLLAKTKKLKYILGIPMECPAGTIRPEFQVAIETVPFIDLPIHISGQLAESMVPVAFLSRTEISEMDILKALDQDKFCLAFQPIQSAGRRKTVYYEALLRYRNHDGSLKSAFPYITAAERLGLISRLDLRAFEKAKMALWKREDLKLSLNVSAGTIADDKTRAAYISAMTGLGDRASDLIIELTETMTLENLDLANQFSARIQGLGAKLAIDDFGAGHTSFENLMGIEAQILKLDGSLIRDLARDPQKQNFVRLLAEMAQVFGLQTVGEMIDNEADAKMAERLGVNYLQGFWLGRPTPLRNIV